MKEINKVVLTGEVFSDAVFAHTPRGTGVVTFTLAFFAEHRDSGCQQGRIDVICLGDEAKRCAGIIKRSERVRVEGSLQQRSWKTPEGFQKSKTEIIAHTVESLGTVTSEEA